MERTCDVCGEQFEAKSKRAKYCSDRCRQRRHRGAGSVADVRTLPTPTATVEAQTRTKLEEVDRLDTPLGQAALVLARRLDDGIRETGAGLASLTKQFQATFEAATANVQQAQSPLDKARDELAERRARRGA